MKRIIRVISLIVCLCLSLVAFSSCKKNENTEPSTETTGKFESGYRVELANFESWYPDFSLIRIMENFGKVTRNEKSEFVKTGKYSAKIQPIGGFNIFTDPTMYFPFQSTYYDFNYADAEYLDHVDFWIYNDSATNKVLKVGLVNSIVNDVSIKTFPGKEYTLNANSWNLISYYIDLNVINITQTITASQIRTIKGLYLTFEHAENSDVASVPAYYIDDVNMYYKKEANAIKDVSEIISFDYNEKQNIYEICDFEKVYQSSIFAYIYKNVKCIPTLSVVNAVDEQIDGFQATSGAKVLKVVMNADPTADGKGYTELVLSDKIMRAFYNEFVIDYNTLEPKIPVEQWDDYRIAYDVYCDFDTTGFTMNNFFYKSNNSTTERSLPIKTTVKTREWSTFSVSLSYISDKLNSRNSTTDKSIKQLYDNYAEYFDRHGFGERISNAGRVNIFYYDSVEETRVLYIDNIRMYKV